MIAVIARFITFKCQYIKTIITGFNDLLGNIVKHYKLC